MYPAFAAAIALAFAAPACALPSAILPLIAKSCFMRRPKAA